jgi:hypothetical protein
MICQTVIFSVLLLTSAPTGPPPQPKQHEESKFITAQTSPKRASTKTPAARCNASRIVDRAIQALRETNLLVREGKRARSEVLPVCESARCFQTRDGLRSTRIQRARGTTFGKLQNGPRNLRRDLRHQSRVAVQTRGAVAFTCRLFARQRSPCLVCS